MIYIIAIEPIDTRYTGHWFDFVPKQIAEATGKDVTQIAGAPIKTTPTEGAFLDFAATNMWKNDQAVQIAYLFSEGKVKDGDYFLYMDAWNPTAIQTKYMADLFGVKIKMGGIWHAGSYDENDFLGRKIQNKSWSFATERALYCVYDNNFFATDYHKRLFERVINVCGRSNRVGFPMEYYIDHVHIPYNKKEKEDLIVFPHRISPEKKPELFKELAKKLPEYRFVICQEQKLTKEEYHAILCKAKIVFSSNLQETLGIGIFEGMMAGALPLVPDRLSYSEMYINQFTFNKEEETNLDLLAERIRIMIRDYKYLEINSFDNFEYISETFFNGKELYKVLNE